MSSRLTKIRAWWRGLSKGAQWAIGSVTGIVVVIAVLADPRTPMPPAGTVPMPPTIIAPWSTTEPTPEPAATQIPTWTEQPSIITGVPDTTVTEHDGYGHVRVCVGHHIRVCS